MKIISLQRIWERSGAVSYTHLDVYKRQILGLSAILAAGCGGQKQLVKPQEDVEVVVPCSGPEYMTSGEYFRGWAPGKDWAMCGDVALLPSRFAPCELTDLEAKKALCTPIYHYKDLLPDKPHFRR